MKKYWGVEVQFHALLTSALVANNWSTSSPGRFNLEDKLPGIRWIGS